MVIVSLAAYDTQETGATGKPSCVNESDEQRLSQLEGVATGLSGVEIMIPISNSEAVITRDPATEVVYEVAAALIDEVRSTSNDVDWIGEVTVEIEVSD